MSFPEKAVKEDVCSFPSSSLGMQFWKLLLPVSIQAGACKTKVPKLELSSIYTSQGKPEKPSFRQGCRNPGHGRWPAGCANAWFR